MIIKHQKFDFGGKTLIEKLFIETPYRFNVNFQNEGCFVYFLQGTPKIMSAFETRQLESLDSALLKCGGYIADLLKSKSTDRYEIIVIHLHHDILKKIYEDRAPKLSERNPNSTISKITSDRAIQNFIDSVYFYFETPAFVDDDLLELKIKELIILLLRSKTVNSLSDLFSYLFTTREVTIKELIKNHLFSPLSVEDLATLASMSLSTFNRAFQSIFKESPASYLKTKRLERARDLLITSGRQVSEIAYDTGFNDLAHFSRSFKEQFDLSPSKYRHAFNKEKLK